MKISLIDNVTEKLLDTLNSAFYKARKIKLAVAFVKYSGFSLVEKSLYECLRNGGEIEFLIGLDFRLTEPKVLRIIHQMSNESSRVKCYCFSASLTEDSPVYHPKLYLVLNDREALIIIGSSNLTMGGLRDNIEVNTVINAALDEEIVSDVYALYNRLKFQQKRFEPDLDYIENYEKVYDRTQKRNIEVLQEERTKEIIKELKERERVLPIPSKPPELFGWQKIVYEKLPLGTFRTGDMYIHEGEFQRYYPENRHVREKIRQVLQQLRDMKLIRHLSRGEWEKI